MNMHFLMDMHHYLDRKIRLNFEFEACHLGKAYDHNIENNCSKNDNFVILRTDLKKDPFRNYYYPTQMYRRVNHSNYIFHSFDRTAKESIKDYRVVKLL